MNKKTNEKYKTLSIPLELWNKWENICEKQMKKPRSRILMIIANIIRKEEISNDNI
jgi:hypothetical protein